jgi:hypothetical protein
MRPKAYWPRRGARLEATGLSLIDERHRHGGHPLQRPLRDWSATRTEPKSGRRQTVSTMESDGLGWRSDGHLWQPLFTCNLKPQQAGFSMN